MAVNEDQVLDALAKVPTPNGTPITRAGVLSPIVANDGKVFFSINVPAAEAKAWESVRAQAEAAVKAIPGVTTAMIALTAEKRPGAPTPAGAVPQGTPPRPKGHAHPHGSPMAKQAPIPGVDSVVAVASGKGGVGKSTTALNLALGLAALGKRVGILDADIYGPSVPKLTGINERPQTRDGKVMIPIEKYGLKIMSIGFLVDEATPMIWRGPMVMSAITQMLREVDWGKLDILVVDMPPGTGDAQLTLAQTVPVTGAVIVSTPQDLVLIDARRGAAMFERVNIPVLGVIENMSYFLCPHCGTRHDIFGHGGARQEASKLGLAFLGDVPLHMDIRQTSDAGTPLTAIKPDSEHAQIYRTLAERVAEQLATVTAR